MRKKKMKKRKKVTERRQWSNGVEGRGGGTDCEQEDGVTAANQISLSLGCLMSILLCDSHLTTLSTMNTRSTRFSVASLLTVRLGRGCIKMELKQKRKGERERERRTERKMLWTLWGSFIHV